MNEIGKLIRDRRKELGLTLEEVGQAIGVGRSCVLKYEKGDVKCMKASKILPLAKVLQISPITLLEAVKE